MGTTQGTEQFNEFIGRGMFHELSDIPITGLAQTTGLEHTLVSFEEQPAVPNAGYKPILSPTVAYLVERFEISAHDGRNPGRLAKLWLTVVGRQFGPWPLHVFRCVTWGVTRALDPGGDTWYVYDLTVPVMIPSAGQFEARLTFLDYFGCERSMSVAFRGKLARPL